MKKQLSKSDMLLIVGNAYPHRAVKFTGIDLRPGNVGVIPCPGDQLVTTILEDCRLMVMPGAPIPTLLSCVATLGQLRDDIESTFNSLEWYAIQTMAYDYVEWLIAEKNEHTPVCLTSWATFKLSRTTRERYFGDLMSVIDGLVAEDADLKNVLALLRKNLSIAQDSLPAGVWNEPLWEQPITDEIQPVQTEPVPAGDGPVPADVVGQQPVQPAVPKVG